MLIQDLLTTLETLRTGDVEDATQTLRRLLDATFDLKTATEDYASDAEQAAEQRAYGLVDEVLSSFESLAAVDSDLSPLALFTRAFDGVPIRVPQRAAGGHVEVMGMLDAQCNVSGCRTDLRQLSAPSQWLSLLVAPAFGTVSRLQTIPRTALLVLALNPGRLAFVALSARSPGEKPIQETRFRNPF